MEPTDEQKKDFKTWLTLLGSVMPCKYCRESYKKHIQEPKLQLSDSVMANRVTLIKWAYDLKNTVNEATGTIYALTFDDFVEKYESYRARCVETDDGCLMTSAAKKNAFDHLNKPDCPIISYDKAIQFKNYAIKRGMSNKYFDFLEACKDADYNDDIWLKRNEICSRRIKNIRENGLSGIESEGEYKGLPTLQELKLMMMLSSTLCKKNLDEVINKMK